MSRGGWVTIYEIARQAGVSPSTVSRVLNGTAAVAPAKRQAVLAVVESLGYRPNLAAQGLARGRFRTIGVLTEDISSSFFAPILEGLEQGLRETPYWALFASGSPSRDARPALEMLLARRVDGLLVVGGSAEDERIVETARTMPVVVIARFVEAIGDRCLHVENAEGARRVTRHLIDLGHRRIVYVSGIAGHRDNLDRYEGYQRGLQEAGIPLDPRLVAPGDFLEASGFTAVEALLRRRLSFTAVFAANDQMALGARLALHRAGLRVPEDVSLAGFDDQPACAYMAPPLTTVRQPTVEMGLAAARALVEHLDGAPLRLPTFSTELIVRESTAPPRRRLERRPAAAKARPSAPRAAGSRRGRGRR